MMLLKIINVFALRKRVLLSKETSSEATAVSTIIPNYVVVKIPEIPLNFQDFMERTQVRLRLGIAESEASLTQDVNLKSRLNELLDILPHINVENDQIEEMIRAVLSSDGIIADEKFVIDEYGQYVLSHDRRVGFINGLSNTIQFTRDQLSKIISGLYLINLLKLGDDIARKYVANQVRIGLQCDSVKVCIRVTYQEGKFIWVQLHPCLGAVISDVDFLSFVKK